ncbi:WLM-domain-containing protein [Favolaschia claudopus]|uniref:WLM-domain-containing protein n=1 Tax=Favolaschia claudopus TaxID=2862362 RepID=A0AAW0C235_9AGAR
MVHVRLNERDTNPKWVPYVNFISALDAGDSEGQEQARQFLRALAAQVKPLMKAHGLVVNSLEEYEYNNVFAGRNWNAGETVELVLRRPGGSFAPTAYIMSTLCHELAHIKHMHHGPSFQALWKQFRTEVRALQDKGYFGDGLWSSGKRLQDSAVIMGDGIETGEFPEFLCGGAQKQSRPTALGRKRRARRTRRRETVASNKTGRQTAKKRKAGGRVKSEFAFPGHGAILTEGGLDPKAQGAGFRKQAASKRAREERALAAERRLQALQVGSSRASTSNVVSDPESDEVDEVEEEGSEDELVGETDAERRQALLRAGEEDLPALNEEDWKKFQNDFDFSRCGEQTSPIEISDEEDLPIASGSTFVVGPSKTSSHITQDSKGKKSSSLGNLVQNEISLRKRESLGMAPVKAGSRVLGGRSTVGAGQRPQESEWACHLCTLLNKDGFLACSACSTPRKQ